MRGSTLLLLGGVLGGLLWLTRSAKTSGGKAELGPNPYPWTRPPNAPGTLAEALELAEAVAASITEARLRKITRSAAEAAGLDPALLWAWLVAHNDGPRYQQPVLYGLYGPWGMGLTRFLNEATEAKALGLIAPGPDSVKDLDALIPEASAAAAAASIVRMFDTWGAGGQLGAQLSDWVAGGPGKGASWFADRLEEGYQSW